MIQQDRYYPRTLVINGDALHQGTATAILISSLFAGWPKDRLAQLYSSRCDPSTNDISGKAWQLDGLRDRIPGYRRTYGNGSPHAQSSSTPANGQTKQRIRGIIRTVMDLVPYRLSPELLRDIDAFRPEVIYSSIGNIQLASLVKNLARRENAATVVHLLDDWIATKHANSWAEAWPRRKLLRVSRDLISHSSACMTGSYVMAEEYTKSFGVPFYPFMHCVAVPAEQPPTEDLKPGEVLRLLYVGGLHLNRWQSLLEIASALEELRRGQFPARLQVYAPARDLQEHGMRLRNLGIEVGGTLRPADVSQVLPRAQVLVQVEAFDTDSRAYTRLSLSTKVTQYLSAGRPLLCYGPAEAGSCRYIERTGAGITVLHQDRGELVDKLRRLCLDRDLRLKLGRAAWETARQYHDAEVVRERFRQTLTQAAGGRALTFQCSGPRWVPA